MKASHPIRMPVRLALMAVAVSIAGQVAAAVVPPDSANPGVIQQRTIEGDKRRDEMQRTPSRESPLKKKRLGKSVPAEGADRVRIQVKRIEIDKSSLLDQEALRVLAANYEGRVVSIGELRQLVDKINEMYRDKGILTSQAILPPQEVTEGIVRIQLVEGRLGKLKLIGNETTAEDFITSRLHQRPGDLVDLANMEQDLVRINRTSDIQISAEMYPGAEFGHTDMSLTIVEPPRHGLRYFVENNGSEATGEIRQGLAYVNRSLFGYRDDLSLSYALSDGHSGGSVAYGFPFNSWGGRATFGYYDDRTQVVEGAFASLNIKGESRARVFSLRHPVLVGQSSQLDATFNYKKSRAITDIDTTPLQNTGVVTRSLGLEYQEATDWGYWVGNLSYNGGRADSGTTRLFGTWKSLLRAKVDLAEGVALLATLSGQYSGRLLLPSSEQIFIGGDGTVRGYAIGAFGADKGYVVNLELHHPLIPARENASATDISATGFFFVDHGVVQPVRPIGSSLGTDSITGAGWGVNLAMGKWLSGRATLAWGLRNMPQEPNGYRVHFQLTLTPF